ncbi:TPA: efflux RND transporter permease subunit [Burkholderia aenigmatica]|uniref:efflux RND transporter permease subunit n=1 Tax=Burkholderia sp. AU45251 TaxID=3059204 RepID=UPI00264D220C|nr:efflux RND transporter permease subunit [Burkholderia sp. AU45251]HDR9483032.1 efflux RND transporter permease subunit [Burkholderia aenigmatica]MDN7515895.1 efflux RND transporter permease subunit [Burkholderia sp. AU45251]HDR9513980.1 efflux RND transporter permease subunit [Burkholderia aenigmatica]HDR9591370.1 efflux RND transporter permease subunit [Burkholderia aenigmatica]HDR9598462.1 efflux RND transporter permease subunit [Burkholderia aenigmatica]
MNFGQWMQMHRRSLLFVVALLAAAGALTAFRLPISLFPNVSFPRAVVSLDAGDRPAEQMATLVTMPVEEALRRVPNVRDVESRTSRGSAEISLNFGWGTDMAQATLQAQSAIAEILPSLPPGTKMQVKRMDPTVFPVLAYSLTSSRQSLAQLRDLAQFQLRPLLSSVDGVARVEVTGGAQDELQVAIDPARLAAYKLSVEDVSKAIGAGNVLMATGRIEDHYKLYLVVADTTITSLDTLRNAVVSSAGGNQVRVGDIATVSRGTVPQWIRVTADGQDAVLVNVFQQPGANSVAMAAAIRTKLAAFEKQMPPGVHLANWYDQSQLVIASASSVRDAILIGVVLAAFTLFVFLRNWKITAIAVALVPVVMSATILLLDVFGMGFNIMTLGGMAAAVGLVIDDAIVMIEHIARRMREAGAHAFHGRVMSAALEFTRPLAGSSAATLIIFVPLAFLSGVTGAFFKALSITMASALFISFVVSWLAIPILCDHWLTPADAEEHRESRLSHWMNTRYAALIERVSRKPVLALAGVAPLLIVAAVAFTRVGSGFMPSMDEGGFVLDYHTAPGTSVTETDRLMREVETIIRENSNVATYSRRTGAGLGGDLNEPNKGDFFVRLKSGSREPIDTVMEEIRSKIEANVPGVNVELAQLMEDLIGDLTAVPQPVQIKIYSDDPRVLESTARRVAARIAKIQGIVDVDDGINPAGDALDLHVRPDASAAEGMDPQAIAQQVSDLLEGNVATQFQQGSKTVGVRVWVANATSMNGTGLGELQIRAPDGHLFPLKRVTDRITVSGQPEISRDNLKRMVAVTARIDGRDLGSTIADVQRALGEANLLPSGVYYELGGLYQQQQIAFRGLLAVFGAAVALVFGLLLFLYERFRVALAVMAMPLCATGAVFIGLWVTGIELNISAMMGMTMIVGIVTEVAIFYVSEFQALVRDEAMAPDVALLAAGRNRLRPIAMTTIAAILALLPLAFALGQGSAMQQPLAVAIISGLIVQLPLVLLVLPVLLRVLVARPGAEGLSGN